MIAWYGAHIGGLWITNADGTNSRQISDIVGYTAPAWTRDGKYVLAGGSLIDVMTGAVIPIPWVSNPALRWTFVEAGARP